MKYPQQVNYILKSPKELSDQELYHRTDWLAKEERRIGIEFLHHLAEVNSRKLHLQRGYPSLFAYLVEYLKFSEAAAWRRIQSMKALHDTPELEGALAEGKVTMTAAAKLQTYFQEREKENQAHSLEEKMQIFRKAEGLSTRQVESMVEELRLEAAGQAGTPILPKEKERALAYGHLQISFVADEELSQMLERLRNLASHSNPDPSYLELFKLIAKIALQKLDPVEKAKRSRYFKSREKSLAAKDPSVTLEVQPTTQKDQPPIPENQPDQNPFPSAPKETVNPPKKRSRYISADVKHEVNLEVTPGCRYVDPITGKKCGSLFQLQYDHCKVPFGKGGNHSKENISILCSAHNLLAAQQTYPDLIWPIDS